MSSGANFGNIVKTTGWKFDWKFSVIGEELTTGQRGELLTMTGSKTAALRVVAAK